MLIERNEGRFCAGVMLNEVVFPNLPIIMHQAGMDFLILDYEHGSFDYMGMAGMIMVARLSGIPIMVRLPDNSRKDITKVMDMGADGLLLPMTNSVEEISEVVRYAKYAPVGQRGISTNRGHTFYNPGRMEEYMEQANGDTMIFAQIETGRGVKNMDEILDADGVDGIFIGPNDLSCDLGCLDREGGQEPVLEAIRTAGRRAAKFGKRAGIITEKDIFLEEAEKCGFDLFCCGSEISFWKKAGRDMSGRIHKMSMREAEEEEGV